MWDFLIKLFGDSPNAILVLAGGAIAIASLVISGRYGAQKELQNGKRAGGPVAIKAALDELISTNRQVVQTNERLAKAKEEEIKVIERMAIQIADLGSIIGKSNRLTTESNRDFAENLNLMRQNNQVVHNLPDLVRALANEQRQTTAAINTLANTVLSKR